MFHGLKEAILSPPVLTLPKLRLPYYFDTDASKLQLGAVLFHNHPDGEPKPLDFFSRAFMDTKTRYSGTELEFAVVV